MVILIALLSTQITLHALQPDFIQKKLHDVSTYKYFLERTLEEKITLTRGEKDNYIHKDRIPVDCIFAPNVINHDVYITTSHRQNSINKLHYEYFFRKLNALLFNILPHVLCKLITEYTFTNITLNETYKIGDEPIVAIYPINNSRNIILMDEEEVEHKQIVLFDSQNNTTTPTSQHEWNHWKSILIKQPQALPYHQQTFADFDQSDENVVAIDDSSIVVWSKNISYEKALAQGYAKRVKEINRLRMGNRICNLTTSAKFSTCGKSVIIGQTDGLIEIFDMTTGDSAYSIWYDKIITALGIRPDSSLLVGFEDGSIDVLNYQCTQLHLDQEPSESTFSRIPEPMVMHEYEPSYKPRDIASALCIYDCLDCLTHCKTLCKTCGQCCYTGISCLSSCPICCWACVTHCWELCLDRCTE